MSEVLSAGHLRKKKNHTNKSNVQGFGSSRAGSGCSAWREWDEEYRFGNAAQCVRPHLTGGEGSGEVDPCNYLYTLPIIVPALL